MTSFPLDSLILNKIVEVFNQTRSYILLLFPLAFFTRILLNFLLFKNSEDFINILKDTLLLALGLFFFTDILKLTLQIPYFVASDLSISYSEIKLEGGFFSEKLKHLTDMIGIICYWISFSIYMVIVCLLGFFSGYILFLGTMFRMYNMLKVFFLLLLVAGLWPLIWHSINFAVLVIAVSDNAFSNNVIVSSASIAKVLLPLWVFSKISQIQIGNKLKQTAFLSSRGLNKTLSLFRNENHKKLNSNFQENVKLSSIEANSFEEESQENQLEMDINEDTRIRLEDHSLLNNEIIKDTKNENYNLFNEDHNQLDFVCEDKNTSPPAKEEKESFIKEHREEHNEGQDVDI